MPILIRPVAIALLGGALTLTTATMASGIGAAIDRFLEPARFSALSHAASGQIAVVEMDARSASTIGTWPWPRENYARVVDRLRDAGARSVVFDVDLSSASNPASDRALASALARADGLVALPTFGQDAGSGDRRRIDALPLPMFREHAALASVSILPDIDGVIRAAPLGTVTDGIPRPSLASYIAHRSGAADTSFPIDYAIEPGTVPRFGFTAVRDGRFDPRAIAGRDVLIGATAIEMGDRYGTPRWGVMPGVVIQALAAETLLAGVPVRGGAALPVAVALLFGALVVGSRRVAVSSIAAVGGIGTAVALVLATQTLAQIHLPLAPALILLVTAWLGRMAQEVLSRFQRQRTTDEATNLPNRRALVTAVDPRRDVDIAVAQIVNYDSLAAVLGEGRRDLVLRVADRLSIALDGRAIHRVADRLLAVDMTGLDGVDLLDGLRVLMLQPIEVSGRRVDATIAIGVSSGVGAQIEALTTEAALAADEAHRHGRFWQRAAADLADLERQVTLMGELDAAIADDAAHGGLAVYYQPKLALADDRIASVEALIRWRHPVRGMIGPDMFIPLAEQSDRIAPLTLFVIEQVMRDLAGWHAAGHRLTAAVNISAKLLTSDSFNDAVAEQLTSGLVAPSSLVFEVTESAAIADPAAAVAALEGYRTLGVAISMDDYGTGQSTLTYLRQLPLSELKIDRSFVQHAHLQRNDAVLVRSTIDLAHDLGLKVVAEGVEDAECLAFLRTLNCDMVQGYLISRPLPAAQLLELLGPAAAIAA